MEGLTFQQDGAPAHHAEVVQTALDDEFLEGWLVHKCQLLH